MPRLEIVKLPLLNSAGANCLLRARFTRSAHCLCSEWAIHPIKQFLSCWLGLLGTMFCVHGDGRPDAVNLVGASCLGQAINKVAPSQAIVIDWSGIGELIAEYQHQQLEAPTLSKVSPVPDVGDDVERARC